MNPALWVVAGLLSVLMLNATTKLFGPKEKLATTYGRGWMADNSVGFVKTLGALELLAAVGLISVHLRRDEIVDRPALWAPLELVTDSTIPSSTMVLA